MSLTVAILTFVFVLIVGALAYLHEFKKHGKKFTGFQITIIIAMACALFFGIWNEVRKSTDSKNDKNDIIDTSKEQGNATRAIIKSSSIKTDKKIDQGFSKTDKKLDTGINLLKNKKSIRIIPSAILGLSPTNEENPQVIKTAKEDSFGVRINFTNYGTGTAFNINGMGFYVSINKGKLIMQKQPSVKMGNKSIMWYPGININYGSTTNLIYNKFMDSTFFCLKVDFSDSSKIRKSFPLILWFDPVALNFKTITDYDYNRIEKFNIENKRWKPPFRQ